MQKFTQFVDDVIVPTNNSLHAEENPSRMNSPQERAEQERRNLRATLKHVGMDTGLLTR